MENLEYSFIIRELKAAEGKHFSNLYKIDEKKYRMKFGDLQIILEAGKRINVAKYLEEPTDPDHFVNIAKQHLDNLKVKSIIQNGGDRIIIFDFSSEKNTLQLVFEGFGEGNLILVKDGKTLVAMREESWSDREIKRNIVYSLPKSNVVHDLSKVLSEKYIISALLKLPLGKEYAKEILKISGIDEKKPGTSLSEDELVRINTNIENMLNNLTPTGFYQNNEIADYGLTSFSKYAEMESKTPSTLSEAIDEFYFHKKEHKNEQIEKLARRMQEQNNRLGALQQEAEQITATVDYIYSNYEKIDSILAEAKRTKIEDLEAKFKSHNAKVNKKNKEMEIEI